MKLCLVTAFPPSTGRLNEYGFHIATSLRKDPEVELTILADTLPAAKSELPGFDVRRAWSYNSLRNPALLLRAIRQCKPDVVWFNLVFPSFGDMAAPAFLGLCIPALTRAAGYSSHVTLHHLMESVNFEDAGVRHPRLYRWGGRLATKALLLSHSVSVLLPGFQRILAESYKAKNARLRFHGIFSDAPVPPDFSLRGNPPRILVMGEWGTYKRLETLVEAFNILKQDDERTELVIAGRNHPVTPGYIEGVMQLCRSAGRIRFTGYVPEPEIAALFRTANVLVLPYSSGCGASGVAHLACEHGLPIISSGLKEFQEMGAAEGMAIDFYRTNDPADLARKLRDLLDSPQRQQAMSQVNYQAGLSMRMSGIVADYTRSFMPQSVQEIAEAEVIRPAKAFTWSESASKLTEE